MRDVMTTPWKACKGIMIGALVKDTASRSGAAKAKSAGLAAILITAGKPVIKIAVAAAVAMARQQRTI